MKELDENGNCPDCKLYDPDYEPQSIHIPIGSILRERYLIGRVLGQGGFGITYIGRDLQLDIRVAVKEYYPWQSFGVSRNTEGGTLRVSSPVSAEQRKYFEKGKSRFLDEARIMARLAKEPSIVRVQDFFELNNTAYIVMEYIDGITLGKLVEQKGGRIPPEELFPMMEPLFRLMQKMHGMQLLHRDVSPDNIMIENGEIKLLDFGCARDIGTQKSTLTAFKKPGYAPPEQMSSGEQGPWTDVYAFGGTIYFCLTGNVPPEANNRLLSGDPLVPPTELGVNITEAQEKALLHSLVLYPNLRTRSMEEFHKELYADSPSSETGSLDIVCCVKGSRKVISASVSISLQGAEPDGKYGDVVLKNGSASFTVKSGEKVSLHDIPAGAEYKVTAENVEGYVLEEMRAEGSISKNACLIATLEYTRTDLKKYSLSLISKTSGGKPPEEYAFKVTLSGDEFDADGKYGEYVFSDGIAEIRVSPDKKAVIPDIPEGTSYTVEALAVDGFRPADPENGVIDADRSLEFKFVRKKGRDQEQKQTVVAPETDADNSSSAKKDEEIKGKGRKKKKSPIMAIIALLVVIVAFGGLGVWYFFGRGRLPSDAEILFEYTVTAQKDGSRWVILNEDSVEFHDFLNATSLPNSYIWAEFGKEPSWVTFSFEEVRTGGDSNVAKLYGRLNDGVYNARGQSAYRIFVESGLKNFAARFIMNGAFDRDTVKVKLYVIKTFETIEVPDDSAALNNSSNNNSNIGPRVWVQLFAMDTSEWIGYTLKDGKDVLPTESSPFSCLSFDHSQIDTAAKVSYDNNPSQETAMKLLIRIEVPEDLFKWPDKSRAPGTYGSKANINISVKDIVLKADGYNDVVIDSYDISETLQIKQEIDWIAGNSVYVDLGYAAFEQLGLTTQEYADSYVPALSSVRFTTVVNSIEMVDVDFDSYTSYEWPDDSAAASGSFTVKGNDNMWNEYDLAQVIGSEFTDWDGNYNFYVVCNSHSLIFCYEGSDGQHYQVPGNSYVYKLSSTRHETIVVNESYYKYSDYTVFWRAVPDSVSHTLTVNYLDTDGNSIAERTEMSVEDGRDYIVNQFDFDGYTFDRVEGDSLTGKMDSDKTVTFYYKKNSEPLISGADVLIDFATLYDIDPASDIFRSFGGYPLYADFEPYNAHFGEIINAMKSPNAKIVVSHTGDIEPMLGISQGDNEYTYRYSTTRDGSGGRKITIIDCEHFVKLFTDNYSLALEDISALWIEDQGESDNFRVYSVQILKTTEGKYENTSSSITTGAAVDVNEFGADLEADLSIQVFMQDRVTWSWVNLNRNGAPISLHKTHGEFKCNGIVPGASSHFNAQNTNNYSTMPTYAIQIGPCNDEYTFSESPQDGEHANETFNLDLTVRDIVIKAEGYNDVKIDSVNIAQTLNPIYRAGGWYQDASVQLDLYADTAKQAGVYEKAFIDEYLPNIVSISYTIDVNKLEVVKQA